ncbi:sigma-70 family RNA polymerase sigma factor [Streptomyces sp. NPDC059176]|uniref:sigma-70 family RNA polymerase sigma factor n=1 Tax=unclassified Streptomyces TaxID=2593676 RepID=UPI0036C51D7B
MGSDGRDEAFAGPDAAETGETPSAQIPGQPGPRHAKRPGRPPAGRPPKEDRAGVPSQREAGSSPTVALPPSDADLIRRMHSGDDRAYEELYRRHAEAVHRYARTCCRDADTAEDLTAEVFARTLQAVRGGAGPEHAVRAYLLTTVRRVAAAWAKSTKREQLVEDFAVFADQVSLATKMPDQLAVDVGADVRAMHEAEQSLAVQAFRSLPERWQAVLWHTAVEEASPGDVAALFGLSANATAVLASRAREGLKQAYLQAHVSSSLTSGESCARYADRLGAYARGGLRMRAERGLRKHLEECAGCRLAAGELEQVNAGIPALLPVALVGWFAAEFSLRVSEVVAGGAAGAVGAGAGSGAGAGGAVGAAAGAPAAAGPAGGAATGSETGAGAASGAAGGGGAGGSGGSGSTVDATGANSTAVSHGLGGAAKTGMAAAVAVAAAVGIVWALSTDPTPGRPPQAQRASTQPVAPDAPASVVPSPPADEQAQSPAEPSAEATPSAAALPGPAGLEPKAPAPGSALPEAEPEPTAPARQPGPKLDSRSPTIAPPSAPAPAPAPTVYRVDQLDYRVPGGSPRTRPAMRPGDNSWVWQRSAVSVDGAGYAYGVTVRSRSAVTIDLNRQCTTYDALVGIDDLSLVRGSVRFSVHADGVRLWRSPVMRAGNPAVPVHVAVSGRRTVRLVVEPQAPFAGVALADWALARISCA